MFTVLRYSLSRMRWQILGWGLALALIGAYLIQFFDTMVEMRGQMEQMLSNFPAEMMAFFGDLSQIFTPPVYLHVEFFSYMPMILGIFAVLSGSGLLAGDEEQGTLDLILAYPISRSAFFAGRFLAFTLAALLILMITWLGFIITLPGTSIDLSVLEMALPFLSLFAVLMLFGALALFFSMLLPARRMAAMLAGLILLASFFITSLARIDPDLELWSDFSPLTYYQGGEAITGMDWVWFAALLGFSLLFALLAGWRFLRRDIRVAGEGSWRFSLRPFRMAKQAGG